MPASSGCGPARAGRRDRPGSRPTARWSGPTSPTTACCAGTRAAATSPYSASRPTTPTATPSTARAGSSPASTWRAASTRTEHDGRITVLADRWQGKRLNSPNDVVVKSDGSIWFTDPDYGIGGNYEGDAGRRARSAPATSTASIRRAAPSTVSPTTSSSRTASPSRPTSGCSTSSTAAAPTSRAARCTSAASR